MTTKTQLSTTGFQRDVQGHWIEKDPNSQLVYSLDWSDWLDSNETITQATFVVTPSAGANDIDIEASGIQLGTVAFVELSKGVANTTYTVKCTVQTSDDATDVRRFRIKVRERYV
jgi:archaellin